MINMKANINDKDVNSENIRLEIGTST